MEPFVVARGHRVARRADIAVMVVDMLRREMPVADGGEQDLARQPFPPVAGMDQLMGVIDADRPRRDADPEEEETEEEDDTLF